MIEIEVRLGNELRLRGVQNRCRTPTCSRKPGCWSRNASTSVARMRLVVAARLVPFDVRQAELDQHAADVLVLELDGPFGASGWSFGVSALRWSDFLNGLPKQFRFEHVEVVGRRSAGLPARSSPLRSLRFLLVLLALA